MGWVKIDDGFARHPKVVAAGPLAMAMQVAALCYCNRELTDGFVPRSVARTLLDWEIVTPDDRLWTVARTCGMTGDDVDCNWVIEILVDTGMWHEVQGGYEIHDYDHYQPTKAQIEEMQAAKSEAGKKGADSRWHGKQIAPAIAEPMANEWQSDDKTMPQSRTPSRNQTLNPKPTPEASSIELERAKPKPKTRNHQIPDDWAPSPGVVRVAQELHMDLPAMQAELDKFASHFRANGKVMADWNQAAMNWLRRSLDFARPPNGNANGRPKGPDFAARALERRRLEQETEL